MSIRFPKKPPVPAPTTPPSPPPETEKKPLPPPPPPPVDDDKNYTGMKTTTDEDGNKVETVYKNGVVQSVLTTRNDGSRSSVVYNYDSDGNLVSVKTSEYNANDKLVQKLTKDKDGNITENTRYFYDAEAMMEWLQSDECKNAVLEALGVTEEEFLAKYGDTLENIAQNLVGSAYTGDLNGLSSTALIDEIVKACVSKPEEKTPEAPKAELDFGKELPEFDKDKFSNPGEMMTWINGECKQALFDYLGIKDDNEFMTIFKVAYGQIAAGEVGYSHVNDLSSVDKNSLFKEILDAFKEIDKKNQAPAVEAPAEEPTDVDPREKIDFNKKAPEFDKNKFSNPGEMMTWINGECKQALFDYLGIKDDNEFTAIFKVAYGQVAAGTIGYSHINDVSSIDKNTLFNEIMNAFKNIK